MKKMILASSLTNVAVLIPVCAGLLLDASWAIDAYDATSPARGILLSVYGAILLMSMGLTYKREPMLVAPLLLVQVLYKLSTPFTVGSFVNPVVVSNLLIAVMHLTTLSQIYSHMQRPHDERST